MKQGYDNFFCLSSLPLTRVWKMSNLLIPSLNFLTGGVSSSHGMVHGAWRMVLSVPVKRAELDAQEAGNAQVAKQWGIYAYNILCRKLSKYGLSNSNSKSSVINT